MSASPSRRYILGAGVIGTFAVAACTRETPEAESPTSSGPQEITADEAEILATMRFQNFNAGIRSFTARYAQGGVGVEVSGFADFRETAGYVVLRPEMRTPALISFRQGFSRAQDAPESVDAAGEVEVPTTPQEISVVAGSGPPMPPPEALYDVAEPPTPLDPETSINHAALAVITKLADDRPENPLLLQQNGARRVGDAEIDGTKTTGYTVTEAAGATYWITDGGLLLRMSLRFGDGDIFYAFGPADDVELPSFPLPEGTE